jgi:hypothetical protein
MIVPVAPIAVAIVVSPTPIVTIIPPVALIIPAIVAVVAPIALVITVILSPVALPFSRTIGGTTGYRLPVTPGFAPIPVQFTTVAGLLSPVTAQFPIVTACFGRTVIPNIAAYFTTILPQFLPASVQLSSIATDFRTILACFGAIAAIEALLRLRRSGGRLGGGRRTICARFEPGLSAGIAVAAFRQCRRGHSRCQQCHDYRLTHLKLST